MTAQRAALRRVKALLATFTAKDDDQRFCATAIDSTFTKPRLVKFTVADLRAVVALAERAAEAERRIAEPVMVPSCICGYAPGDHTPRPDEKHRRTVCRTYIVARVGRVTRAPETNPDFLPAPLAPPRAGKRADRPSARAARSRKNRP